MRETRPPSLLGKPLTFRERQVLDLVAEGKTNKEISDILGTSEGTIKVVISTLRSKLALKNRAHLAVWWTLQNAIPWVLKRLENASVMGGRA